ncbi:tripartite tricarboxylate transporter permease [Lutibaculum baratangense]|uniref:Tricarboxylate transport membrane protein TctA n=1 Tax=Lutibaculum baratangense AMV1 TaxID=631454 RepID=V4RC85_9HYPH|nr:tripartite tricarboxylate transporter permease [Lutibaculum baratangense]ESR23781.1 Tricarboxylate transport membrane protein TctA [Lutibaculum baratangense AMV1]
MMEVGFLEGLAAALTLTNLGYALAGCLLGTMVGVLPGLGPSSAMAILLPSAIYLPPEGSIIVLAAIYYGAMYGGSTTAILMNIPGEVASVVTTIDGFAMTKDGRAGQALAISAVGSFIAGIGGTVAIALIGPAVAGLALAFGPPEYFGLVTFSMIALVSFSGNSLVKGIAMGLAGMWLASLGTDPLTGAQRMNFGSIDLMRGFDLVPVLVGLFGVAEVFLTAQEEIKQIYTGKLGRWWSMLPRGKELARGMTASLRGTLSGFVLGILPGMLPALTAYLAYDLERRISRTPERFGNGAIEGVAAPEAANNATAMGGFIPLLSLGVPTSPALAIMLGALMINGVQPGPALFGQHALMTWTVIASMLIANAVLLFLNLPLVGLWARLSLVPYRILGPIILAVCLVGAFAPRNSMFDVWTALGFGLIGYAMRKGDWPAAPLILGFLLGPLLEQSLRQSLSISGGSLSIFFERSVAFGFLLAACLLLALITYFKSRSLQVAKLIEESNAEV